jgi:O-antigen ligase
MNYVEFDYKNSSWTKLLGYGQTGISFMKPIPDMHPVYYGSYIIFMAVLLTFSSFKIPKPVVLITGIISAITIVFLNSRIIFLCSVLVLLSAVFIHWTFKKAIIYVSCFILLLFLIKPFVQNTYLYNKLVKGTTWELTNNIAGYNLDKDKTSDSRMSRWIVSTELFLKRPLFGYGTGSSRVLLQDEYQKRKMETSIKQGYDSHNQYLGFAIEFGLIGLFAIGCFVITNFIMAFRGLYFEHISFMIIVFGICFTENYLIRNMGINFVALYGSIMSLNYLWNDT